MKSDANYNTLGGFVSGSYKPNNTLSDKSKDNDKGDKEKDTESPTESPTETQTGANHFDIDLADANFSVKLNSQGGYDIVVRDATASATKDAEPKKATGSDLVSILDVLQIALLAAIFVSLMWDKIKPKKKE